MRNELQVKLLEELVELQAAKRPYLDEAWVETGVARYFDAEHFERERRAVFLNQPRIALHASELPEPGAYKRLDQAGRPLLLVRGEDGVVRGFYNVCRHRGAQLVGDEAGCSKRFSCPYHAWTWSNQGELIGVPHEKTGFPGLDRRAMGLHSVACAEAAGWIWVSQQQDAVLDIVGYLGDLYADVAALAAEEMTVFRSESWEFSANWKLIIEGGFEAYHFRVAHRDTIAPLFLDNLSSYQCFGNHIRSVLPRSDLAELRDRATVDWDIRKHSNLIYTLFPSNQLLVQQDHIAWIALEPLAADRTRVRLSTVVPTRDLVPERERYWQKNHDLTVRTLREDFAIGEGIQKGFSAEANTHLNFGRFEGALHRFSQAIDRMTERAASG